MSVHAVIHRLVIQPVALEEYDETYERAKAAGIEIARTEDNKYVHTQIDQGTVLDIGPTAFLDYVKVHNQDIPVKVGDVISYARHSGKVVKDPYDKDAVELTVINDTDVICVYRS